MQNRIQFNSKVQLKAIILLCALPLISFQEPIISITRNEFVYDVLTNDISTYRFDSLFDSRQVSHSIKPNRHNRHTQDTVFIFKSEVDYLKIYKAGEKSLPLEFSLQSSNIILSKHISVGMHREDFTNFFDMQDFMGNKIIIQDLEGGNLFKFTFSKNILSQIEYLNTYLD